MAQSRLGKNFLGQWVAANLLSMVLLPSLSWAVFWAYGAILSWFLTIPIASIAQWVALRRYVRPVGLWVLLTPVGIGAGLVAAYFCLRLTAPLGWPLKYAGWVLGLVALGAVMGLCQSFVLRRYLKNLRAWLVFSAIATPSAIAIATLLYLNLPWTLEMGIKGFLGQVVVTSAFAIVYSLLTGLGLMRSLRLPSPQSDI